MYPVLYIGTDLRPHAGSGSCFISLVLRIPISVVLERVPQRKLLVFLLVFAPIPKYTLLIIEFIPTHTLLGFPRLLFLSLHFRTTLPVTVLDTLPIHIVVELNRVLPTF